MRKLAEVVRFAARPDPDASPKTRTETTTPAADPAAARNPLYGVAMLKIAMELKKHDGAGLDDILQGVLRKMNLPEHEFRAYLAENGGLLRAIAQRRRY